jgi:hypothetical protein
LFFSKTNSASSGSSTAGVLAVFLMAMSAPQALLGFPLPLLKRDPTSPVSPTETWGKAKKTSDERVIKETWLCQIHLLIPNQSSIKKKQSALTSFSWLATDVAREFRAVGHSCLEPSLSRVNETSQARKVERETKLFINEGGQRTANLISASVHQGNAVGPGEENRELNSGN